MFKNKKLIVLLAAITSVVVATIVIHTSKSDKGLFGNEIPADAEIVSLAQVLNNPQEFDGKEVVMEGTISVQCASLCFFNFREGNNVIEIPLNGFNVPRIQIGRRVRVISKVYSGSERVVISATGLRLL